jgi:invasion protein IalB
MSETPPSETPSAPTRMANAIAGMPSWATNTLLALAVFLVGGIAGWIGRGTLAGPPDVPTMSIFQDWHLLCPDSKDKGDTCELSQDVISQKEGARLARISLFRDKTSANKSLVMAVTVPLEVFLEPGLGLKIGDDQVRVYQYKTCTEAGCSAVIPVDDAILASLEKAQDAGVVVASPQDGKAVELPFTMKGYAEAWKLFRNNDAKHKSWWRRLWS